MRLSIITISYNNANGLLKTIRSVEPQTYQQIEHIIIDGGSQDNSKQIIEDYIKRLKSSNSQLSLRWISEPDSGIYNAMNKGIKIASGDYCQFLNSGDCLVAADVTQRMIKALEEYADPPILYGNMLKDMQDGVLCDRGFAGQRPTMLGFYNGTLNHSPAYIRRTLFEQFGLYDEQLRIVSDWKWYLQAIVLGGTKTQYTDIDVTLFDMNGISESNKQLDRQERRLVLEELVPLAVLKDYDLYADDIYMMRRLHRYALIYRLVWFVERVLFKWEKLKLRYKKERAWG